MVECCTVAVVAAVVAEVGANVEVVRRVVESGDVVDTVVGSELEVAVDSLEVTCVVVANKVVAVVGVDVDSSFLGCDEIVAVDEGGVVVVR